MKKEGIRVDLQITLPKERIAELWRLLREYEQRDPTKIHLRAWVDAPDLGLDELEEALRSDPKLDMWKVKKSD
jgi:hypothetical protein